VVGSALLTFPLRPGEAPMVLQYVSTTTFNFADEATGVTDATSKRTVTHYDGDGNAVPVTALDGS
jgi:hypothetical protein